MRKNKISGSLLIELMLFMSLSLMVMAGMFTLMLNVLQQTYYQSVSFSLQRQWIRIAHLLYQEIGMAGYQGCLPAENSADLQWASVEQAPQEWFSKAAVLKPRSIALHLEKLASVHDYLLADHISSENEWVLSNHARFKVGDTVFISDCAKSQWAQILSVKTEKDRQLIQTTAGENDFYAGSSFGLWQKQTFYLAETGRKDRQNESIFGLYSYENQMSYEWAEGVEDLQGSVIGKKLAAVSSKQYQEKNLGDSENSQNLRPVLFKLSVLLKSLEKISNRSQQYFFNGQLLKAEDGHLYQAMEVDVPLQEFPHEN